METMKVQLKEIANKHNANILVAAQMISFAPVNWYFLINGKFFLGTDAKEIESQLNIKSLHDLKEMMIDPVEKIYLHTNPDNLSDSTLTSVYKIN